MENASLSRIAELEKQLAVLKKADKKQTVELRKLRKFIEQQRKLIGLTFCLAAAAISLELYGASKTGNKELEAAINGLAVVLITAAGTSASSMFLSSAPKDENTDREEEEI